MGSPDFMFDLVVMDEAGQCSIAMSLIPIAKAKSLLMVGDPNLLQPVITLEEPVNKILYIMHRLLHHLLIKSF